jgi:glycosyltransferase involved in cell wall biosynthesis
VRVLVVTVVHVPLDARIHHRQIRALRQADVDVTYAAPWTATGTATSMAAVGVTTRDLPRAQGRRRLTAIRAARRLVAELGPVHDLILLHDPELVLAVRGRLADLPPVVLDVHEDLPASLVDRPWVPAVARPLAERGARRLEAWAERRLHLLLAEEAYRHRFRRPHPVVPNLPWLPADVPPAGSEDRVVHVGRLSVGRGARELLALGERLTAAGGPSLVLAGPADAEVATALAGAHARGTVTWHGLLPNDQALDLVRGAVAGLALLHDLPNYRVSLPTKIVEYLAHGVPAVATPLPVAREVVEASGGGLLVPFEDVEAVAAAVDLLATDEVARRRLGDAGRAYVAAAHSWDAAAPAFVDHLRDLAGSA